MIKKIQTIKLLSVILTAVLAVATSGCTLVLPDAINNHGVISDKDTEAPQKFFVAHDGLRALMEHLENGESIPTEIYEINVSGLSSELTLTMQYDTVIAAEAYGHKVQLKTPLHIYGNYNFSIIESGDAIIIEGGYYHIGDVYVITPESFTEYHPGEDASYWLWTDDDGALKYALINNSIAGITQEGPLPYVTGYDELLYALGDAEITDGELTLADPYESFTMSDKYDLDGWFESVYADGGKYADIGELFAANRERKENKNHTR